jgi:hypothetical protein
MPLQLENGTAGSPALQFTNSTNMGLYRVSSNAMGISVNGTQALQLSDSGMQVNVNSGYRFFGAANSGMTYLNSSLTFFTETHSNPLTITNKINCGVNIRPVLDNTFSCGESGLRWTAVHAANGTIQTSHSSTKTDILELTEDVPLPIGIQFKRPGDDKLHYGFLADDLPVEILYDGIGVETSAVVGILCRKLKAAMSDIESLKAELTLVKSQLPPQS